MFYLKNKNKDLEVIKIPKVIIRLARTQLAILFIMLFIGVLIARV